MHRHGPRAGSLSPWRGEPACRALTRRHRRTPGRVGAPTSRTDTTRRAASDGNAAHPRDSNPMGHSVEITEDCAANGATGCRRENSVSRGAPTAPEPGADFATSRASKLAPPHNLAVEQGRRHAAGHRWPAARECPRRRILRRASQRARTRSQPPGLQRRGRRFGYALSVALDLLRRRHPPQPSLVLGTGQPCRRIGHLSLAPTQWYYSKT